MTIEERAQAIWELRKFWWLNSDKSLKQIEQHLRDQIEECAKVLDQHEKERSDICSKADKGGFGDAAQGYALQAVALMRAATEIRALAAPTEQTEGKGIER